MRLRIFYRLLLLQAAWNFERMQNIGFAFGIEPWLKHIYKNREEELKLARLRHLEPFSTQPHMASLVAGMVCGLEEQVADAPRLDRPAKIQRLMQLKTMTAAALAGLGDALFWATLRPFAAALALVAASVFWRSGPARAALAAAVVLVVSFNLPGLYLRFKGLGTGYAKKEALVLWLKARPWQKWIRALRLAGLALVLIVALMRFQGAAAKGALAIFFAVKLLSNISNARLYAGLCLMGVVAAALWEGPFDVSLWSWP